MLEGPDGRGGRAPAEPELPPAAAVSRVSRPAAAVRVLTGGHRWAPETR